jgi:hypothetical protein
VARTPEAPAGTTPGTELNQDGISSKKGRPTPTRKEVEAARKRPLVSNDRAERRRQERAAAAEQREKQRIGMAKGDEKYLPARDRGPQRKYVRDYMDARWSVGEILLYAIAVFFVTSVFPAESLVVIIGFGLMWFVLIAAVIDIVIAGFILKRRLTEKFGEGNVAKGFRLYAAMRAAYPRYLRLPKPQVKRGDFPE